MPETRVALLITQRQQVHNRDTPRTSGAAKPPGDAAARSADQLVDGVHVGGGVPEFRHLAVAQMEDVRFVDLDAPAAPAGRDGHQRDAVLIVGQDCMKVDAERSLSYLHELAEEPVDCLAPAVLTRGLIPPVLVPQQVLGEQVVENGAQPHSGGRQGNPLRGSFARLRVVRGPLAALRSGGSGTLRLAGFVDSWTPLLITSPGWNKAGHPLPCGRCSATFLTCVFLISTLLIVSGVFPQRCALIVPCIDHESIRRLVHAWSASCRALRPIFAYLRLYADQP